jgi:ABC-type glycerol-3-phosphate transport system permease component
MIRRRVSGVARGGAIAVILALFLLPLAWTALASFGLSPNVNLSPPSWPPPTLDNYAEVGVAEPGFAGELETSALIATGATILATASAFLLATALRGVSPRTRRRVTPPLLVLAALPVISYLAPLGEVAHRLHVDDVLGTVVFAQAAASAPLAAFVLAGAITRVGPEVEDAARLDGAGRGTIIGRILLPITWPSVAATAVVVFILNWNVLLVPLVLTAGHVRTIAVAMSDFFTFERELDWTTAAAAIVVSLVPLVVLVAVLERFLARFSLDTGAAG